MDFGEASIRLRKELGGLLGTKLKKEVLTAEDLSTIYTPGIAEPCRRIAQNTELAKSLTIKKNMIAVISDGSAVLGLGNIGPEAALPVMEGKCMLFKHFGDVDAIPLVLNTQDTDEIVNTIANLAPTLGGINLEDIAAPRCFEIEAQLTEKLDIPVFHDDQHGTAIVVLAGIKNALRVVNKDKSNVRVVIAGAGAAGIATATLLKAWGIGQIEMIDSKGIISCDRDQLSQAKEAFCTHRSGTLKEAIKDADIFLGVSKPDTVTADMVRSMADDPIVFAMANPIPEIMPEEAHKAGVAVMATGRSDFPNQINNCLVFPGLFRGLLDAQATEITMEMKLAAAEALADLVITPTAENIIPSTLDETVAPAIAQAVKNTL